MYFQFPRMSKKHLGAFRFLLGKQPNRTVHWGVSPEMKALTSEIINNENITTMILSCKVSADMRMIQYYKSRNLI